ncbi:MAG: hypothetical protein P8Y58_09460 [Novosphingobium sp.]
MRIKAAIVSRKAYFPRGGAFVFSKSEGFSMDSGLVRYGPVGIVRELLPFQMRL